MRNEKKIEKLEAMIAEIEKRRSTDGGSNPTMYSLVLAGLISKLEKEKSK